ncbi:hypothetical protein CUMW_045790 [Citrus unshiu]|nr:hypothetical protein CUMW_045790 [Citrus unshiu]
MIKHIYLPVIPMRTLHASSFLSPPADSGMINQGDWASEILGHKDSFSSLAFSTDGQLLASGGFHGLVQNRDTSSGNLQCTVEGPRGGIEDSTVWMWNADRGAYLNMFSGHGSGLTCGDFTTDGKTICTGSDNATLSIWNPKGGENFHVIRSSSLEFSLNYWMICTSLYDGVTCLSWPGTSKYLVTGCVDGKVEFGIVFPVIVYEHSAVTLMPFSLSLYLLFENPSFRFQLMGLPESLRLQSFDSRRRERDIY